LSSGNDRCAEKMDTYWAGRMLVGMV
jgi:hypothetical protein